LLRLRLPSTASLMLLLVLSITPVEQLLPCPRWPHVRVLHLHDGLETGHDLHRGGRPFVSLRAVPLRL